MLPYCSCLEIKDPDGKEYRNVPEWHNCDYINKRNMLIPIAEAYAEEKAKNEAGIVCSYKFTHIFSTKMDELAYEYGIV
jgi:hypothetical protein